MATGVTNISFGVPIVVSTTSGADASGHTPSVPAHPVAPVPAAAAVGHGGNSPPPAGDALPAKASAAQSAQAEAVQLQAAVDGINRFLRDSQRQMLFQVDLKSGKETLTIINPATGEVIRQIPSAQVLAAAANLQQAGMPMAGLFIDERA